jgi:hypothetical protein
MAKGGDVRGRLSKIKIVSIEKVKLVGGWKVVDEEVEELWRKDGALQTPE